MSSGGSTIEQADAAITKFFASWDIITTTLVCILFVTVLYPIFTTRDPDLHPFLLARQAQAAPIRHPEESAVLRAIDIPHGYPLRAGLNVKDPNAPKWSAGRNGDLRDIWRQAVQGSEPSMDSPKGSKGKIMTVLGREKIVEHSLDDLTQDINAIGKYLQDKGAKSVAVCLSNSVELLCTIFASAFYDFSVVLLPYGQSPSALTEFLAQSKADILVAEAGFLDLDAVTSATGTIRQFVWVVKEGSKHIDWTDTSHGVTGGASVNTWHNIISKTKSSASKDVPVPEKDSKVKSLFTFSPTDKGSYEMIEFTSNNLISGTAGLNATLSRLYKLTASDLLLPTIPLTNSYALCWTLAALFNNASVALNSVAGPSIDLTSAVPPNLSPTHIVTSSDTMRLLHTTLTKSPPGLTTKFSQNVTRKTLKKGMMPLTRPSTTLPALKKVKAFLVDLPSTSDSTSAQKPLSSATLSGLRLLTGSRIAYALTAPYVAGAVTQTNVLDYRDKGAKLCIGPPVSSVEINLKGSEEDVGRESPTGQIVVKGPAVSGGTTVLQLRATVDDDYTLVL